MMGAELFHAAVLNEIYSRISQTMKNVFFERAQLISLLLVLKVYDSDLPHVIVKFCSSERQF